MSRKTKRVLTDEHWEQELARSLQSVEVRSWSDDEAAQWWNANPPAARAVLPNGERPSPITLASALEQ